MSIKTVIIGGGSVNWTPKLAQDLFLREGLTGSELVLVDTDPDALALMVRYCSKLAELFETGWRVKSGALAEALDGADTVCLSISTGGLEAMQLDYEIPESFGIYHTVGDTTGPGGIARTLRNVPVFLEIAREMEKRCPNAWMVHVTNPLNQLTRAVTAYTSIKTVGLCHNYASTMAFLATFFDVSVEDIQATCVGLNHATWLTGISVKGQAINPEKMTVEAYLEFEALNKNRFIASNTTDDDIEEMIGSKIVSRLLSFNLYELFGAFPVGGVSHVAENFPFFLNEPEVMRHYAIHRKGVIPQRIGFREYNLKKVIDRLEGHSPWPERSLSAEEYSAVVESLHTGKISRVMATLPNTGQVSNLPAGVSVETWAMVDSLGVHPLQSGEIPAALLGIMMSIVMEIELSVEAAVSGSFNKVKQALFTSPMLYRKNCVDSLAARLIDAHRAYLPQFN
ncbi:MAG: hypothetical protein WC959_06340 [Kiritimatiellales bacterium]